MAVSRRTTQRPLISISEVVSGAVVRVNGVAKDALCVNRADGEAMVCAAGVARPDRAVADIGVGRDAVEGV